MKTAIIVPLWNHLEDLTEPFVDSIRKTEGDWELILVDNGSDDDTAKYLKKLQKKDKRVKAVYSKTNTGFGEGNNLGYGLIGKDVERVCFISNDVIINDERWLITLNQYLDRFPQSLIGPQLVTENMLTAVDNKPTPYIAGWCVFSDRKLFDQMLPDVWSDDFPIAYFEDVWMSVEAQDLGYDLKEAVVDIEHMGSKSSDFDIPRRAKENQLTFLNKMMVRKLDREGKKRIVFFASTIPYPFIDPDFEGRGVGGAESSLILLAREFAKGGWEVEIYNRTDVSGEWHGVKYRGVAEFNYTTYADVFVLFRGYHPAVEHVNAALILFWSCDQYTDMPDIWDMKVFPNVDKTVCISPYHKQFLDHNYKTKEQTEVIELGVVWDDYKKSVKKVDGRAIYCSVPMRGLRELAKYLPTIKARYPKFELIVTSDYRLWGMKDANNGEYAGLFDNMPYVKFLGKLPREKLVHYQKTSMVMAYPCNYEECFCISALECMAAGAIPVTTKMGALPTTVGDGGILLSNSNLDDEFVDWVVELMKNRQKRLKLTHQGRKRAESRSWDKVFKEWVQLIRKETKMAKRKTSKKKVKKSKVTAPEYELPKFTMLKFTRPVEFAINGRQFVTKPQNDGKESWHQVEVPFKLAGQGLTIIREAYGQEAIKS